jgi:hypothetical protein
MRSMSKEDCKAYREVSCDKISQNEHNIGVGVYQTVGENAIDIWRPIDPVVHDKIGSKRPNYDSAMLKFESHQGNSNIPSSGDDRSLL